MTGWKAGAGLLVTALLALATPNVAAAAERQTGRQIGQPIQPVPGSPTLLELEVSQLTPRVVTAATPDVTVTGRVTNTGDRRVDEIQVRLQRGEALESDRALRDAQNQSTDAAGSPFHHVGDTLEPGQSADVSITVPIRGDADSLRLDQPGVYPLLVNVNGRPDFGGQARLAAVFLPLPVLSLPGGPAATPKPNPPGVTVLWPLLDEKPRRLPTTDGKPLLADDKLADSLGVGGRLFSLVNAVRTATSTNTTLLRSLCFALDPDLLQTVAEMRGGYRVRASGGQLVEGKGADAATEWLTRVQDLTRGHCVIAVPYADADLVALSRSGAVDLAQLSLTSSSIVSELLAVQPAKEIFWPAGGSFDQRTLIDLAAVGPATVLADPNHLQQVEGEAPYRVNGTQTANPVRALPVDSLVSESLASSPRAKDAPEVADSVQSGLAALAYRAAFDHRGASAQVLVAPPRRWSAATSELDTFLDLTQQLFDDGFATPLPLLEAVAENDRGTANGLSYAAQDTAQEIPAQVTAEVMRINATKRDLLDAMADDNTSEVDPNMLLAPMQYGLLRGTSSAWRGKTDQAASLVDYVDAQLDSLRRQVVVNNPGRPLSLASGDSPIPVNIYNGLPVTIVVRINLSTTPGLRPEAYPDVQIPPLSSITEWLRAEVIRAGRFTVDVRLSTPGGTPLGSTARLELNSTSYGIISVAVTGTAAGVLVLLVGIRIFRRVRSARADAPNANREVG